MKISNKLFSIVVFIFISACTIFSNETAVKTDFESKELKISKEEIYIHLYLIN